MYGTTTGREKLSKVECAAFMIAITSIFIDFKSMV